MWFSKATTETLPTPVPPADPVAEASARLAEVRTRLARLDATMLAFRTKYKVRANRFGQLLGVESPGIGGYQAIAEEWRGLLRERDGLMPQFYEALKSLAAAKTSAQVDSHQIHLAGGEHGTRR